RLEQMHLALTLRAESAGPRQLIVSYELPGASWEAAHEIRVRDGNRVSLISLARIRQSTGENWENVKFSFSTRRPGQNAKVPQLETMLLGKRNAVNPMAFTPSNDNWNIANKDYL